MENKDSLKRQIIDYVNKIDDVKILRLILGYCKAGYNEERAGHGLQNGNNQDDTGS
jgi:hypothetical protein